MTLENKTNSRNVEIIHSRGYYATVWEGQELETCTNYEIRDIEAGGLIKRFKNKSYEDHEIASQAPDNAEEYYETYRIVINNYIPSREEVIDYCKKHNLNVVTEHFQLPFDFYPDYEDALATEFETELS